MRTVSLKQQRTNSARKHAYRVRVCLCGKECRGNGGWSSHKRACLVWKSRTDPIGN